VGLNFGMMDIRFDQGGNDSEISMEIRNKTGYVINRRSLSHSMLEVQNYEGSESEDCPLDSSAFGRLMINWGERLIRFELYAWFVVGQLLLGVWIIYIVIMLNVKLSRLMVRMINLLFNGGRRKIE